MSVGPVLALPSEQNDYQSGFVVRVAGAFAQATGRRLIEEAELDPHALSKSAWHGDFALLTHRGGEQAVLNYGNAFALALWECDWDDFTATPSAATAPNEASAARDHLMEQVAANHFVSAYSGERVSRSGKRFVI